MLSVSDTVGFILAVPERTLLGRMGLFGTAPGCFLLIELLEVFLNVQLYILSL